MRDLITRITFAKTLIRIDRMPLRICKTNDPDYIILYREGGDWVTGFYRVDDDNLFSATSLLESFMGSSYCTPTVGRRGG